MRKNLRVVTLAAVVVAVAVPVGFALSLDPRAGALPVERDLIPSARVITRSAPFLATTTAAVNELPDVPEGAKLLMIGGVLFGVAAAMRRTTGDARQ